MEILLVAVILLAVLLLVGKFLSKKAVVNLGKDLDRKAFSEQFNKKVLSDSGLIYFYGPNCSVCKTQSRIFKELDGKNKNIFSIDISEFPEEARYFNILATPTIVSLKNDRIEKVYIGLQNKKVIEKELDSIS